MRKTPAEIKKMNEEDAKRRAKELEEYGEHWELALLDAITKAVTAEAFDANGKNIGINIKKEINWWYKEISNLLFKEMMIVINMNKELKNDFYEIAADIGVDGTILGLGFAKHYIKLYTDNKSIEFVSECIVSLSKTNKAKIKEMVKKQFKSKLTPVYIKKELNIYKKGLTAQALKGDIYRRSSVNYK